MSVTLALFAMLIELGLGYPQRLLGVIGHPVTWIGRLIDALDRRLNGEVPPILLRLGGKHEDAARRLAGILAVLALLVIVGVAALLIERTLFRLSVCDAGLPTT